MQSFDETCTQAALYTCTQAASIEELCAVIEMLSSWGKCYQVTAELVF